MLSVSRLAQRVVLSTTTRLSTQVATCSSSSTPSIIHSSIRSFSSDVGSSLPPIASFNVYRTRYAVSLRFLAPTVITKTSRAQKDYSVIEAHGSAQFEFTESSGNGFDWFNKVQVNLTPRHIGEVLAFDQDKTKNELKVSVDTKIASREFLIKRLSNGYFLNVIEGPPPTTSDELKSEAIKTPSVRRMSVGVTEGEFRVIISLIQQALPALIGFNFQQLRPVASKKTQEQPAPVPESDIFTE